MNLYSQPETVLSEGQKVSLIHHTRDGPDIHIPATVVRCEHPAYWIDTEHQKEIKIERMYLKT